MSITVRQAVPSETDTVSSILVEAANWLETHNMRMWRADELLPDRICTDVEDGLFFLAEDGEVPGGTIRFQLTDPLFWPDLQAGDSAFIHRLAIRRRFAGGMASRALLSWAVARAAALGRQLCPPCPLC